MKLKEVVRSNKKTIFKFLLLILIVGTIAVASYFLLRFFGFRTVEDFEKLKANCGDSFLFWFIVVLLQIFQTVFIPISNQLITGSLSVLYNNELWKVWLSAGIGISIGSIILYLIGRFGGLKIIKWLLGDEQKAKTYQEKMKKGKTFYVVGMFIPFIPDDVLSTLAGVGKYNFIFVIFITIIARFTCTAFTTWGVGLIVKYWWVSIFVVMGLILMLIITKLLYKKSFNK